MELSKDITFSANVIDANYDEATAKWTVTTQVRHKAVCKYFICATGSSFKAHWPEFEGLNDFKGQLIHPTRWPDATAEKITKNKCVAIIGSGATGVQCTQEIAKQAKNLTVYIRTANISLPMVQRDLTEIEQRINKAAHQSMFKHCRGTGSGLGYDTQPGSVFALTGDERVQLWQELWDRGGFNSNKTITATS